MKTTSSFLAALTALALSGCQVDPGTGEEAPEDPREPSAEEVVGEAHSSVIDSSSLFQIGNLGRPQTLFNPATGLTSANLSNTQLGDETLTFVDTLGTTAEQLQSTHFRVIRRTIEGGLQIVGREEQWTSPVENPNVQPETLKQAAIARMAALGIPASELLLVRQKKAKMMASEDMVPRLQSHVTYFERGFHGIPVRGSHGSVIHDRAGNFHKLLLHWRPVAADQTGNQWKTTMTPAQITTRATQVIQERGLSARAVKLRYAYAPKVENQDGTTTFALRCMAQVSGLPGTDPNGPDRPEEIEIELDP